MPCGLAYLLQCYCGDDCIDGYECCFRDNNKTEYETCLYLQSKFNTFFAFIRLEYSEFSYYVVTEIPNDGCYENKGCCDSSDKSTIYPVYSKTTRLIYFNKDCAVCHGVDKVEDPEIYFSCDPFGRSRPLNFDEELTKFLEDDKSTLCYLTFDFPSIITGHRKCSIHSVDSLDNLINSTLEESIYNPYNMAKEEIADACVSSFFSPTFSASKAKLYPNPFCYLYGEGTHEKDECYQSSGNPTGVQFMALLNPNIKAVIPLKSMRQTRNLNQVCWQLTSSSLYSQLDGCRPSTYPIGHIFVKNGSCIFFGNKIFFGGRMNVFLNLILRSQFHVYTNESELFNMNIEI